MLYRTNPQSRQIEEALRRYGRKYVVVEDSASISARGSKRHPGLLEGDAQSAG